MDLDQSLMKDSTCDVRAVAGRREINLGPGANGPGMHCGGACPRLAPNGAVCLRLQKMFSPPVELCLRGRTQNAFFLHTSCQGEAVSATKQVSACCDVKSFDWGKT